MSTPSMSRTSAEVRRTFLEFFRGHGHEVVPSSPLVPHNDPTLMFTNAGMVQFKDVFVGKETRRVPRATSSQKCIRISGKHNDLENVGVTARHHTFFEMLGNFSFGDYFKEEAIVFAWELLTKVYGLPVERLLITVFGGAEDVPADDEARTLWRKVTGFSDDRILGIPGAPGDNFWQMGDTGPCGPCTEIHWYNGDAAAGVPYASFGEEPSPGGLGWMEIWNLVFMQFERSIAASGAATLAPLPKPCVDTGAGLERVASVIQGVTSNYETDLLRVLVAKASELSGKAYGGSQSKDDVSMRVIADHARTTSFLIAEGVFPDRAGREYVLRRVMRRAIRHGHRLGIRQAFLHEVSLAVADSMGHDYPELEQRRELITSVARGEEERFRETIERGLKMLDEEIAALRASGGGVVRGETVFKLHDTFGFPPDLTQVITEEHGLAVDVAAYDRALEQQRARSEGSKLNDETAVAQIWRGVHESVGDVKFVGYDRESGDAVVLAIVHNGQSVPRAEEGTDVAMVTDRTPFYGEAGGQVGDKGTIEGAGSAARFHVSDTIKPVTGLVAHVGRVAQGSIGVGDPVHMAVDHELRLATRRNHSATHLLHWALRTVLGPQATQKGSLVGPDRLRFDFSHARPMSAEEIASVEDRVNAKILGDAPVLTEVLSIDQARKRGAMAIFEEKYGDVVRMLTMTPDSVELCGGTHARTLGEIGLFKVTSEQGLAAGVRRIEAVTGLNALLYVRSIETTLRRAARVVKGTPSDLTEKVEKLVEHERQLEREVGELNRKMALGAGSGSGGLDAMLKKARDVPGGKALAVRLAAGDAATLRETAERLRDSLGASIVLVGAAPKDKAMLVLSVSKALVGRYSAGDLIRPIAEILGGSGGGRADMAQAGGPLVGRLDEALESLYGRLA
jgi:alanyl-tRNA synthetase